MTQRRVIKQRSQAVWDRAQAAYLAGEPAASVARRFDVGLGNLRYRANKEGWTRRAAMERAEAEADAEAVRLAGQAEGEDPAAPGPPDAALADLEPARARDAAIARAASLLAAGRTAEATATIRAARALGELISAPAGAAGAGPAPPETAEEAAAREAADRAEWEAVHALIEEKAADLAAKMLAGENPGHRHSLFAHRWRAETLGPEVAAEDLARAYDRSSHPRNWTADGDLLEAGAHDERNWKLDREAVMAAMAGEWVGPEEEEG